MKHLTMTGYDAGKTYCGAQRDGSGQDGVHGAYVKDECLTARALSNGTPLCPMCCSFAIEAFACADGAEEAMRANNGGSST